MKRRHLVLGGVAAFGLGACTPSSKFKTYTGPEVTYIVVNKEARQMYLLHNNKVLKDYQIDLGFAPIGDKFFEGDGRTPEGTYLIDRRNPDSKYHLSLGISYPNEIDRAEAKALGKPPGGDIFIHGNSSPLRKRGPEDWTWGCIAVTDSEIEDVYAMVRNGTPIQINP
jgi:murein L,D-transpeptidase YafK